MKRFWIQSSNNSFNKKKLMKILNLWQRKYKLEETSYILSVSKPFNTWHYKTNLIHTHFPRVFPIWIDHTVYRKSWEWLRIKKHVTRLSIYRRKISYSIIDNHGRENSTEIFTTQSFSLPNELGSTVRLDLVFLCGTQNLEQVADIS